MTERYQILEGYQERQTIIKILDSDNEEDQIEIDDETFELKGTKSVSLTEFKKELVASALKYLC